MDYSRGSARLNDMHKITKLVRKMSQCSKAAFANKNENPILNVPDDIGMVPKAPVS